VISTYQQVYPQFDRLQISSSMLHLVHGTRNTVVFSVESAALLVPTKSRRLCKGSDFLICAVLPRIFNTHIDIVNVPADCVLLLGLRLL
jgi:hypothetical protein